MANVIVIPARMGSKRLPDKPIITIDKKPMVVRVAEQGAKSVLADKVIVATDHKTIAAACWGHQFEKEVLVRMTPTSCKTGTDRIAHYAVSQLDPNDVIVNLQGDLPFADPRICDQLFAYMNRNPGAMMGTVAKRRKLPEHREMYEGTDSVKVVVSRDGRALYFSRMAIPYDAESRGFFRHHIGMYAYRVNTLKMLVGSEQPEIEQCESLEQLRALYSSIPIHVVETEYEAGMEINTWEDWLKVRTPADPIPGKEKLNGIAA